MSGGSPTEERGKASELMPSAQRFGLLEAGRGIAAMAVVVHHAGLSADAFTSGTYGRHFDIGALGVDFFFVLSGFIITYAHRNDPREGSAARQFMGKRLRRIYIPYLPVSVGMMVLYIALPELSAGEGRAWGYFTSLTLLPSGRPPALSVAWTLVYEMTFYSVFLLSFVTRHFRIAMASWAAVVAAIWVLDLYDGLSLPVLKTLFNPLILEFLAGMLAAHLFTQARNDWKRPILLGLAGLIAYAAYPEPHRVFFGLALAPLVLGLARLERASVFRIPRPFILLGAASYSIYLVHNPLQSVIARIVSGPDMWWWTWLTCTVLATVAGVLFHLVYERPALRWAVSLGRRRNSSGDFQPG